MIRQLTKFIILLGMCLLIAACGSQSSLVVYITPTHAPQPQTDTFAAAFVPPTPRQISLAPTAQPNRQVRPTVTWMGPVIGADYVPPPTFTPVPPTADPNATPTTPPEFPDVLPNLNRDQMGIQFDVNLEQEEWDEVMRRLGDNLTVKWIKVQIPWRDMQPNSAGEVSPFWQRTRLYLEDAERRGFNILLSIAKAPAWARSTLEQDGPPADPQAFADFLTQLLGEYGGFVDAIEVWNEPNLLREWQGTLPFNGAGYMQLFRPAYQAIRAYSPTMTIVTAGLAPTGDSAGSRDDRAYLREMYANGLASFSDVVVGVHPYSWANPPEATCCGTAGFDDDPHFFFSDNLRDYRQIMSENGHNVPIWITEFGWATWDGYPGNPPAGSEWMLANTRWEQANYTIRAFEIVQRDPNIDVAILWNLNFATIPSLIDNRDERIAYSLVVPGSAGEMDLESENRTERPLYWMVYDAIRPDVDLNQYD